MREIINIIENAYRPKRHSGYIHGSRIELPVGTILTPQQDYLKRWGNSGVYRTLEKYRPPECLPHSKSVFMVKDNEEDIYNSGGPRQGWLFEVEPIGNVERHNLIWFEKLIGERSRKKVAEYARRYWFGMANDEDDYENDLWEYVAEKVKITAVYPYSV